MFHQFFYFVLLLVLSVVVIPVYSQESETEGGGTKETDGLEKPVFDIWEIRVQGNTVLSNKQVESAIYGFLGPGKTFDDVQLAQAALGEVYRNEGYAFASVSIPQQSVDKGIVKLAVVEGKLGRVRITGNRYFSRKEIRKNIPSMQEGSVPRIDDIQRDLALLNRTSRDRSITPLARPGKEPDTVDLELKVKDALPFHYGLDLNGRNSPETSRTRFGANFSYENLWQKNHAISLFYQTTPEDRDEVEVKSLFYSLPLWMDDSNLSMYYIRSDSEVATVGDVNVLGDGRIKGVKATFPFFGQQDFFHQFSIGLESKDFDQSSILSDTDTDNSPIDYTLLNMDYSGRVNFDRSNLFFGAGVRTGLRGFGNTISEFDSRRAGAKNNFSYFVGNLGFNYLLSNDYQLRTRANFQYSGDPLIGNEQFSAGGQFSVRGYLTAQELADEGIVTSVEIVTPDLSERLAKDVVSGLRFVGFLDYAKLHNRNALTSEVANTTLAGTGIGIRLGIADHYVIDLDFARALSDSAEGEDSVDEGDWRTHFGITAQY